MAWMVPLRRLDEAQQNVMRQCTDMADKPKWIEGFAGSGKTVLLVHAVQSYKQKHPNDKVCVVVFTHALIDMIRSGMAPDFKQKIPVVTFLNFVNNDRNHYNFVVVDEVQDVPATILQAISKKTDKILIGGDDAQSIYESGSRADQIELTLKPDRFKLPTVYRLTRKIINVVKNILPDNNIVTATSGRMQETQVTLAHSNSYDSELSWVWLQAKRRTETGFPSVIVLPNHDTIKGFIEFIANKEGLGSLEFIDNNWGKTNYELVNNEFSTLGEGPCLQYLGNSYGSLDLADLRPVVYVMTYHSSKGLDFRSVFLPLLNSGTEFWRIQKDNPLPDEVLKAQDIDRRLFFVGATRSRRDLFLSYSSKNPHPYVQGMPQDELHKIEIGKDDEDSTESDFVF
jgi:MinD-like ATPase involved in chromosome partitioning or flagellar assembly